MLDEKKNPVRKVDVKKCEDQLLLFCSECVGVGSTLEIQVHTLRSNETVSTLVSDFSKVVLGDLNVF